MKVNVHIIISILLLVFNILLSQLFYIESNSFVLSTILVLIDTIVISFLLLKNKENKTVYLIIVLSLIIKVFLMYFELYGRNILVLPNSGSDTEHFFTYPFTKNINQLYGYNLFIRILGLLFGKQRILFQYINIIFSLLTEIITLKILDKIKIDKKSKIKAMFLMCFLVSNMIISVELLREPLMILLNTISLYFFIEWYINSKIKDFILSLLFILISSYFHSSMIICILPYFFMFVFYNQKLKEFVFSKKSIYMFIIAIIMGALIYKFFFPYINRYFNRLDNIESINRKMSHYVSGGSTYLSNLAHQDSMLSLIITSPLKLLYFYFSPMIWNCRGINDILTLLLSSSFYIILFTKYIKDNKKTSLKKGLIIIIIILGLMYGLSCFSTGSAMRHREKVLPYFIVLYGLMFNKDKKKENKNEV